MFKFSRLACICFLLVTFVSISSGIAAGQGDGGRQPINAENAGELQVLATLEVAGSDYFSPDGRYLLVVGETETSLYDTLLLPENAEPVALWTGVVYGSFSPDGRFLTLSNPTDAQLQVIDLNALAESGEPAARIEYAGDRPSHTFSQDSARLFVKTGGPLRWYDLTGDLTNLAANELGTAVSLYTLSGDGSHVAVVDSGAVTMFDLATGEAVFTQAMDSGSITISPNGTYLHISAQRCSVGGCSGSITVYDWAAGELRLTVPIAGYVDRLVYSPDDTLAIYATNSTGTWNSYPNTGTTFYDAIVHVVDLATGEDLFTLQETDAVLMTMSFAADNSRMAYTSILMQSQWPEWSSSVIHIVDIATQEQTTIMAGGQLGSLSADWSLLKTSKSIYLPGTLTTSSGAAIVDVATGTVTLELSSTYGVSSDLTLAAIAQEESDLVTVYSTDGTELVTLSPDMEAVEGLSSLSFSPDNSLLRAKFTLGEVSYITLWELPR